MGFVGMLQALVLKFAAGIALVKRKLKKTMDFDIISLFHYFGPLLAYSFSSVHPAV